MGLFDWVKDIFKGDKEAQPAPRRLETDWQAGLRDLITNYAGGNSPYRTRARGFLDQYLGTGMPSLFGEAGQEISRTLGDYYDPYISKAYEPFRSKAMRELELSRNRLQRGAQAAGMGTSSRELLGESRLEESTLDSLMGYLGELFNRERDRKAGAVNQAFNFAQYQQSDPLRKMGAIQSFEEAPLQMAMQLLTGYQPTYYQPQYRYTPSAFEKGLGYAKDIGSIIAQFIPGTNPSKKLSFSPSPEGIYG